MAKIIFDKQNIVDMPTLLLQNRNFDTIGVIANACNLTYKENFNAANELSFTVYKNIDGIHNPLWESLVDFKIIYIPEFQERFEISVSTASENAISKSVTCTSLGEAELSQIKLYDLEINTETDISRDDYFPTVFYRNPEDFEQLNWNDEKYHGKYEHYSDTEKKALLRNASLLHRIMEKAEHYSIGKVDDSLSDMQRIFSISDTDIYSELTGEIAEEFHCLFVFDSCNRTVSAYDLYSTCPACGYYGEFTDMCPNPECGSTNLKHPHWKNTTVFISNENLATQISLETNQNSLKNCFYVEGGDDIVTAAIRSVNPNGTNYFYCFSQDIKADMPNELVQKINDYDKLYEEYITSKGFILDETSVTNYNQVVTDINALFAEDNHINFSLLPQKLTGYPSITSAVYEAVDLYEFLENSMMPTIRIDGLGLEKSLDNIVSGFAEGFSTINEDGSVTVSFSNQIALRNHTTAVLPTVENAIRKSAKLYYSSAYYDLALNTASYIQADTSSAGTWKGTFTLTSLTETDETTGNYLSATSPSVTLSISNNVELYTEQSIYRKITEKNNSKYGEITNLQMDLKTFQDKVTLYSLNELLSLKDSFQDCLDVIVQMDTLDTDLQKHYYNFYNERLQYIEQTELPKRTEQLKRVKAMYYFDSSTYETSGMLHDIKTNINDILNFKNFIQSNPSASNGADLWKTFCAYRREDKYTNSNYISEGLSNGEIIETANKLIETAKKELYKAANLQYSLSTTMNNLLTLEEFQPLADAFSCGNWMTLGIDDKIFKLRLLSYQINFDDIQTIDVEFSTVEKIWSGISDVKSILDSAASMSQSYSGLVQQMDKSADTASIVNNWLNNGLNATKTRFTNSDEQTLILDKHGLLALSHDDIEDEYSPYQLKILNNGLYTTHDNWNTIDTGIGRITYTDPETGKAVDDYGIIAKTVAGKLFLGENLGIYTPSGSLKFNGNGLHITNGTNSFLVNPNADANTGLVQILKNDNRQFYINNQGDVCFSGSISIGGGNFIVTPDGTITSKGNMSLGDGKLTYDDTGLKISGTLIAGSGSKIGGWTATDTALYNGSLSENSPGYAGLSTADFTRTIHDVSRNGLRLAIGSNFGVTNTGILYCGNAVISGNITATSGSFTGTVHATNGTFNGTVYAENGTIGGFTISEKYLSNNTTSLGTTPNSVYLGLDGISCGNTFRVSNNGAMHSTSGTIGGFTIGETGIYNGCTGLNHTTEGIYLGTDGFRLNSNDSNNYTQLKNGILKSYSKYGYTEFSEDGIYHCNTYNSSKNGWMSTGILLEEKNTKNTVEVTVDGITVSDTNSAIVTIDFDKSSFCHPVYFGDTDEYYITANGSAKLHSIATEGSIQIDCAYSTSANFNTNWADKDTHAILVRSNDGLTTSLGWSGAGSDGKNYTTCTVLRGSTVKLKSTSGVEVESDERLKNSFKPLDEYKDIFMDLSATAFKYNNGQSGRYHFGFKAQDVRDAFLKHGYTTQDFGGFVQMTDTPDNDDYCGIDDPMGLIYTEFTAWNTHMIQQVIKENEALKQRIEKLELNCLYHNILNM